MSDHRDTIYYFTRNLIHCCGVRTMFLSIIGVLCICQATYICCVNMIMGYIVRKFNWINMGYNIIYGGFS